MQSGQVGRERIENVTPEQAIECLQSHWNMRLEPVSIEDVCREVEVNGDNITRIEAEYMLAVLQNRMPRALTAENGAKALLSGEFHETIELPNPEHDPEDFEADEEPETYLHKVPVSWTNIKAIYAKVVEHFWSVPNA